MSSEITYRSDVVVELIQSMGSDRLIGEAAQVSTKSRPADSPLTDEKLTGLINALMRGKHGTPFEHNAMTFYVEAPIFVFREWHRHRIGFSYNETSARYRKKMKPHFWIPPPDRKLVKDGKGMTPIFFPGTDEQRNKIEYTLEHVYRISYDQYEGLLELGIANEVARAVLPVGLYSSMYVTCNARSMMNFLSLRTNHAEATHSSYPQREIEQCADLLESHFKTLFPITHTAYCQHGRVAP